MNPVQGRISISHNHHPRVFVSAAEPSADHHGAELIHAVKKLNPDLEFTGVAGPAMAEAGCHQVFDMTSHAAMLLNAIGSAGRAYRMLRTAQETLESRHYDAVVVIDSPTLHLPLAGRANRLGIPVLYYIAPQLWAWGAHRMYKLRHTVKQVACILPFEESFFRKRGVKAKFVGHPLTDAIDRRPPDDSIVSAIRSSGEPTIAILPGSRRHVIEQVLPGQLEVAKRILDRYPRCHIGVSVAGSGVQPLVDRLIQEAKVDVKTYVDTHRELIVASDLVLAASGTTTLEVAFLNRPMIIMYNASRLMYKLLGQWIVRIPHLSLPNILAGREIVPEFMPYYESTKPIANAAIRLIDSSKLRDEMKEELQAITAPLKGQSASENTARLLLNMV